jgi:hypothetical protein
MITLRFLIQPITTLTKKKARGSELFLERNGMTKCECPHCKTDVPANLIVANRPFHCPECKKIIASESFYAKFNTSPGCMTIFLVGSVGLLLLGFGWVRSLFFSFIAALPILVLGVKILKKVRPRPARCVPYVCRTQTDFFPLAVFLETLADGTAWTSEFERKFESFKSSSELDDDLEQAAIECAQNFREKLERTSGAGAVSSADTSMLESRKQELRAIACDLRLAENQLRRKATA